jgi:hypothetical protein
MAKTEPTSSRKIWRTAEVNLVNGSLKERRGQRERWLDRAQPV